MLSSHIGISRQVLLLLLDVGVTRAIKLAASLKDRSGAHA